MAGNAAIREEEPTSSYVSATPGKDEGRQEWVGSKV